MGKSNLTFFNMLGLEVREEEAQRLAKQRQRWHRSRQRRNLRDFVCKDNGAGEPLLTSGSLASNSSGSSYRDEKTGIDDYGARKYKSDKGPRRQSVSDRAVHCSTAVNDTMSYSSCHCCGVHIHLPQNFHPYVFAAHLKSAVPAVDDFMRSLRSLRNELDLCDGLGKSHAAGAVAGDQGRHRGANSERHGIRICSKDVADGHAGHEQSDTNADGSTREKEAVEDTLARLDL
ncbi:hypothetical protein HRG_001419 [Hirsutella rhossiliensis]|uniref:Uncharacterized protein n=1 Tax=Hirsutella rhossiliensis TaxID=111463 RepID=A0A9P8N883_9HYPO|nr:uncharacterized protein HRG_01419 [Hirsutella rhossiliensis]KAH0968777.1 hypothetical protein HRG_01419 [Hirsutella rhossiliensis]